MSECEGGARPEFSTPPPLPVDLTQMHIIGRQRRREKRASCSQSRPPHQLVGVGVRLRWRSAVGCVCVCGAGRDLPLSALHAPRPLPLNRSSASCAPGLLDAPLTRSLVWLFVQQSHRSVRLRLSTHLLCHSTPPAAPPPFVRSAMSAAQPPAAAAVAPAAAASPAAAVPTVKVTSPAAVAAATAAATAATAPTVTVTSTEAPVVQRSQTELESVWRSPLEPFLLAVVTQTLLHNGDQLMERGMAMRNGKLALPRGKSGFAAMVKRNAKVLRPSLPPFKLVAPVSFYFTTYECFREVRHSDRNEEGRSEWRGEMNDNASRIHVLTWPALNSFTRLLLCPGCSERTWLLQSLRCWFHCRYARLRYDDAAARALRPRPLEHDGAARGGFGCR